MSKTVRVKFTLTMPQISTWNGHWSGEGKDYFMIRSMRDTDVEDLLKETHSWGYAWKDGWSARITASVVPKGARSSKSNGFCGYEWMVNSILERGEILANHEIKELENGQ